MPIVAPIHDLGELETVMATQAREPNTGLIAMPDGFVSENYREIAALAARYKLPAVYPVLVLARAGGRVSTALAEAKILTRQACYRPVTDDGLPLIGRVPGVGSAYVATGHGPWGMLNAPATGLALAELITQGVASTVDLRPFDPARF